MCSFIETFSFNYKLTGIDLNKVCDKLSTICGIKIRDYFFLNARRLDLDDQVKIKIKDWIKKCNSLLEQLANSDPDHIVKCTELHIPNKKRQV